MKNHQLIIYDFEILFNILEELKEHLNFNLIKISKENQNKLISDYAESLILSKKKIKNIKNAIIIDKFPLTFKKFNEIINTNLIKKQFNYQSNLLIGSYNLDLNAKKIFKQSIFLDLTEKEIKLINFLKNSNKPITKIELQKIVWGYVSNLETHTVETHIYRLRKKFLKTFSDGNFIKSNKNGYYIK